MDARELEGEVLTVLRHRVLASGSSLRRTSLELGRSRAYLSQVFTGHFELSLGGFHAILDWLGVRAADLFDEIEATYQARLEEVEELPPGGWLPLLEEALARLPHDPPDEGAEDVTAESIAAAEAVLTEDLAVDLSRSGAELPRTPLEVAASELLRTELQRAGLTPAGVGRELGLPADQLQRWLDEGPLKLRPLLEVLDLTGRRPATFFRDLDGAAGAPRLAD